MTLKGKRQRLEALTAHQRAVNSIIARQELIGNELASVVVKDKYNLQNPKDVALIEIRLEDEIARQRSDLTLSLRREYENMARLGFTQKASDLFKYGVMNYMDTPQKIVETYFNASIGDIELGRPQATEKEYAYKTRLNKRLYNDLQGDIEIVFNRPPTVDGYRFLKTILEQFSKDVLAGGFIRMPFTQYQEALAKQLKVSPQLLDKMIGNVTTPFEWQGKSISERIWDQEDIQVIRQKVQEAVLTGQSSYELAENIQKEVSTGKPRKNIDRIANTELMKAYSLGISEVYQSVMRDFPQFETVVVIELSPFHPKPDICDVLVGTYRLGEAPDVPFHPYCICGFEHKLVKAGDVPKTTNIPNQLKEKEQLIVNKNISIPVSVNGLILEPPLEQIKQKVQGKKILPEVQLKDGAYIVSLKQVENGRMKPLMTFAQRTQATLDNTLKELGID